MNYLNLLKDRRWKAEMLIKFKRKQKWEAGEDNGDKVSRRRKTFNYLSNTWEGQIKILTTISGPLKGKPSLQCDKKKKGPIV